MTAAGCKGKILVVDDEENVRELLRVLLEPAGYLVAAASSGREGFRTFFSWRPDLVILDIRMSDMDGWQLLERIREVSNTPVIMLTALGQEEEMVHGLRQGADDYVVKPFSKAELLARLETVLRRALTPSEMEDEYRDGALLVDFEYHRVFVHGRPVELSSLEFRLLAALIRRAGAVLSQDRLLDLVWGEKPAGPGSLRMYINYLRRKIEDVPSRPQLIETVRGFGYRYQPPADNV